MRKLSYLTTFHHHHPHLRTLEKKKIIFRIHKNNTVKFCKYVNIYVFLLSIEDIKDWRMSIISDILLLKDEI